MNYTARFFTLILPCKVQFDRYSDGSVGVVHSAIWGSSKFTGTRTYFKNVGVVQRSNACALHSSNPMIYCKGSTSGACNHNQSMSVALCKPVNSWILCMYTHMKQVCGFHALADTKIRLQKVGVAHEEHTSALLHLHIMYSLILRCMWSNPGQTRIIFKAGLTWMTRTKCDTVDPDDPTRF